LAGLARRREPQPLGRRRRLGGPGIRHRLPVQFIAAGLRRRAFLWRIDGLAAGAASGPLRMRSVLVVVTRQIGDVLLTTPLIHAARKLWPQAAIDVVGLAGTLGMLRGNPD